MKNIYEKVRGRIEELMSLPADQANSGKNRINRVMGWKRGEFLYDETPFVFTPDTGLDDFACDVFSSANQSKYLIEESKRDGKIIALLKPCDAYSFNQLLREHRINRDGVYAIGIPCRGKADINKIKDMGVRGILSFEESGEDVVFKTIYGEKTLRQREILLERCLCCKGKSCAGADESIEDGDTEDFIPEDRFSKVREIEKMTSEERFEFWRNELSRCIRCNSCRNICPACSCIECVFDSEKSGISSKVSSDSFEDSLFHIIRAYHVAGRCTDCGECSRVCPQRIPLHLINRKFIGDINEFYGMYQAGENIDGECPLTGFRPDDREPGADRGGK